jgi:predicted GNAT family acetyltransferase
MAGTSGIFDTDRGPLVWQVAGSNEQAPLLSFIKSDEWRCVSFSSRLRAAAESSRDAEPATTLVWVEKGAQHPVVTAALMLTRSGVALPVLDGQDRFELEPGNRLCLVLDRFRSRVHSVMGMRSCVLKMEAALLKRPFASIDYHMMTIDLAQWQPDASTDLRSVTVRKAYPEDTDAMFPLQRSYELEEVYLDPRQFDDRRCRSLLRRGLREELVYVAESAGIPVAKAGTNARGFTTDQIGGVFTRKDLRHRGLARLVMITLMDHIRRDKQHACLFVKKDNGPAIRLYLGLGFRIRGEYRISYYGRV